MITKMMYIKIQKQEQKAIKRASIAPKKCFSKNRHLTYFLLYLNVLSEDMDSDFFNWLLYKVMLKPLFIDLEQVGGLTLHYHLL